MHDTYDETTSMLDTTLPLGQYLDEQLERKEGHCVGWRPPAWVRENKIIDDSDDKGSPLIMNCMLFLRVMVWMKKLLEIFLLAVIDLILRNY